MSEKDLDNIFEDDETILKQMYNKMQTDYSESKKQYNKILTSVSDFLKNTDILYAVQGGRAILAWLDPENKSLSSEEKSYLKSVDWDIAVNMSQQEAKEFARKMKNSLEKQLGIKLIIRDENIRALATKSNTFVYQIGFPDIQTDEYFVDIHPEKFENKDIINIDGINYFKLKLLIEQIEETLLNPNKLTKRYVRYNLLKQALQDMKLFNRKLFLQICKNCQNEKSESLTGYNLDCEKILSCKQFFQK